MRDINTPYRIEPFDPIKLLKLLKYGKILVIKKYNENSFLAETEEKWVNIVKNELTYLSTKNEDTLYLINDDYKKDIEKNKNFEEHLKLTIPFSTIEYIEFPKPSDKLDMHNLINK